MTEIWRRHQRTESDGVGGGRRRDQRRHHGEPGLVAKASPRQVVVGVARVETELLRARPARLYLGPARRRQDDHTQSHRAMLQMPTSTAVRRAQTSSPLWKTSKMVDVCYSCA